MREFGPTVCGFGVRLISSPNKRTIFENLLREKSDGSLCNRQSYGERDLRLNTWSVL